MTTATKGTAMISMTDAKDIATRMTDPHAEGFDPIDFHNVAAMSEVILKLTTSKVAENRVLGDRLYTALNFYHIGRGTC